MVRPSSTGAKPQKLQTSAGRSYLEAAQRQGSLPVVIPGIGSILWWPDMVGQNRQIPGLIQVQ